MNTTEDFWDCECPSKYIHPKWVRLCSDCGATPDDSPDSRINEVQEQLKVAPMSPSNEALVAYIYAQVDELDGDGLVITEDKETLMQTIRNNCRNFPTLRDLWGWETYPPRK